MSDVAAKRPNLLIRLLGNKQLFWLLAIVLLFVLSFWWIPGDSTSTADSYSTSVEGKYAFFQTMGSLHSNGASITRSVDELVPDDANVIVILSPARNPSDEEWVELWRFVNSGGRLLFAPSAFTEDIDSGPFGVSLSNSWVESDDPFVPNRVTPSSLPARTWEQKSISWSSTAELKAPRLGRRTQALITRGSQVQVIRRGMGSGSAIFVASDVIFQNREMFKSEPRIVAQKLFELTRPSGRVYFDESLSGSGTPQVLGILFSPLFRPLSLQILLITILFGWSGSRRFGSAVQPASTDRRAIVEHAQALGAMHYKVSSAAHALRSYFEYFRTVAQVPGGRIDKIAVALAARSGIEESEIVRLLTETQKAIQSPNLANGSAATLIQQLANLRDRTMRFGDTEKPTGKTS